MIAGERVRLRAAGREDIPSFVAWLNDPEVRSGLAVYLPFSRAEEEQWFENMLRSPKEEHTLVIEIREADEWQAIGNCSLFQFNWKNRSAELGIFIGEKRCWNQGYGTEDMLTFC